MGRLTEHIEYIKDIEITRNDKRLKYLTITQDEDIDRYRYYGEIKKKKKPKKEKTKILFKPFRPKLIKREGLIETYQHFTKSFPDKEKVEWIGTKKVHEDIIKIKWTRYDILQKTGD